MRYSVLRSVIPAPYACSGAARTVHDAHGRSQRLRVGGVDTSTGNCAGHHVWASVTNRMRHLTPARGPCMMSGSIDLAPRHMNWRVSFEVRLGPNVRSDQMQVTHRWVVLGGPRLASFGSWLILPVSFQ